MPAATVPAAAMFSSGPLYGPQQPLRPLTVALIPCGFQDFSQRINGPAPIGFRQPLGDPKDSRAGLFPHGLVGQAGSRQFDRSGALYPAKR
jgi:hypothetical protein